MDQLDPKEMKDFLLTLRRYCDSSGKDYGKICKELEIEEPSWSGKLNPRQIKALDKAVEKRWASDPTSVWKINPETGLVDIEGKFNASASDDFSKMDIRTGTILEAERVPKTDKLLKLKIDTGIDVRTVVSGIAEWYKPEEIIGQQVSILVNLAPRKIKGIESQGMILMASNSKGELSFISSTKSNFNNGSEIK